MSTSAVGRYRMGYDIGGTFTDFVLVDSHTGRVETYKTLTTPHELSKAVREGWSNLLTRVGATGAEVETVIHATTLITNAMIERKGSKTALVTTKGFKDVLDTQKEMRYDIYDLHAPPVQPLVPRALRWEIEERLDSFGDVFLPLNEADIETAIEAIMGSGAQAVAVCFLHSYRNPAHEQRVAERIRQALPNISISISSEIAPEIREYERMSTAVANAYVQPLTERYVAQMEKDLADGGYTKRLYLMISSGGITTGDIAVRFPVRMVESGPAAGVLVTCFFAERLGLKDVVAFDMGGTTAKMCLIKNGEPSRAHTFEIARVHRFKRGSGLPVRIPTIELIEIGAGGGSIAWVDELGLLKVGPESSGADPGPACYGQGGTSPTVTDANVILGYLNPAYFLGGRMQLDMAACENSMVGVGAELKMGTEEAAQGIFQIVNENMISATRVHLAERGEDPRRLMLMAFGGAGPIHAHAIARALKMKGYVCPTAAGVASALGLLTAPAAFDFAQTYVARLSQEELGRLDTAYRVLEAEGNALLAEAGVPDDEMKLERSLDMRHKGQGHEIVVPISWNSLADVDLDRDLGPVFYERYELVYGHAHRHLPLEVMTIRVRASGARPTVDLPSAGTASGGAAIASKGVRMAYFQEAGGFVETAIYERSLLPIGAVINGPAVIEEQESTAVIAPNSIARVDENQNLVVLFVDVSANSTANAAPPQV